MIRKAALTLLVLLPLLLSAQGQQTEYQTATSSANTDKGEKNGSRNHLFSGFSGGMMLHLGYAFSQSPDELFRNPSLMTDNTLPKGGATMGIGGALRIHLLNHIHIGSEGFVSTMPLMKTGSQIRTGYGGILCDYYANWGKRVRPVIGMTIGGGSTSRLYVPYKAETVEGEDNKENDIPTVYNASYTKTPFFMLDPYIGLEIGLNNHISLLMRVDWVLPFGKKGSQLSNSGQHTTVAWRNYVAPSGPRLYVGFMFGHLKR